MKRRSALVTAFPVERHSQRAAFRIATIAIESEHSTRSVDIVHPNRKNRYPASLGFEPRQRDPESLVLPLHHEAKAAKANAKFANPKFEVSRRSRELTRIS